VKDSASITKDKQGALPKMMKNPAMVREIISPASHCS
jgi:hypothetical protein